MAKSLNHPELIELLEGMKAGMPRHVFAGVLAMVKGYVKPGTLARLDRDLGLEEADRAAAAA
jgi:hypothetical protein